MNMREFGGRFQNALLGDIVYASCTAFALHFCCKTSFNRQSSSGRFFIGREVYILAIDATFIKRDMSKFRIIENLIVSGFISS